MINKLKSIFTAIGEMIPNREKRKKKFFEESKTHSEEMQGKLEPIHCPMHEDYDDVDYGQADHTDEVAEIERKNK